MIHTNCFSFIVATPLMGSISPSKGSYRSDGLNQASINPSYSTMTLVGHIQCIQGALSLSPACSQHTGLLKLHDDSERNIFILLRSHFQYTMYMLTWPLEYIQTFNLFCYILNEYCCILLQCLHTSTYHNYEQYEHTILREKVRLMYHTFSFNIKEKVRLSLQPFGSVFK